MVFGIFVIAVRTAYEELCMKLQKLSYIFLYFTKSKCTMSIDIE